MDILIRIFSLPLEDKIQTKGVLSNSTAEQGIIYFKVQGWAGTVCQCPLSELEGIF